MIWILIFFLADGGGRVAAITSAEFTSLERCADAGKTVAEASKDLYQHAYYVCKLK
jgi:hypothetical protein